MNKILYYMIIDVSDESIYEPDWNNIYTDLEKAKTSLKNLLLGEEANVTCKDVNYDSDKGILDYTVMDGDCELPYKFRIVKVSPI